MHCARSQPHSQPRWGTSSGSLGNYGIENQIPVITFGLPVKDTPVRQLWEEYRKALLSFVAYGKPIPVSPVHTASVPSEPPPVSSVNTKTEDNSVAIQEAKNKKLEKLFENGMSYFNSQKPHDALKKFEEILETDRTYRTQEVMKYIQYTKDFIKAEEEIKDLR